MNPNLETATAEITSEIAFAPNESENGFSSAQSFEQNIAAKNALRRFLREGITFAKDGNRSEARYALLEAVRLDEESETAWLWLASVSEQPAELLSFLQRVLEINPENGRALEWSAATRSLSANAAIQTGAALLRENNRAAAAEQFRQAAELEPNNELAWLWLASAEDEPENRLSHLERILNLNPNHEKALSAFHQTKRQMARTLLRKCNAAAMSGERETAREILCDVMEYDAGIEEAWLLKAYLTDSADEKGIYFRRALEINPQNAQAASGLALLQATDEEPAEIAPETEEEFQEPAACQFCLTENPANAPRCAACKAFVMIDDVEKLQVNDAIDDQKIRDFIERLYAEQQTRELIGSEYYNLGLAYLNLKNFKKGAAHLEQVLQHAACDDELKAKVTSLLEKLNEVAPELFSGTAASGKTIMVVDDSPTVRKLIIGKLEKHGHNVVAAVDGMDALAKINEQKPDLILLDVTMPRLDGYQLCKLIKSNAATKHIPVVLISGKDGFFDKVRGRMAGSTAYITKPFGPETLLQAVETHCG